MQRPMTQGSGAWERWVNECGNSGQTICHYLPPLKAQPHPPETGASEKKARAGVDLAALSNISCLSELQSAPLRNGNYNPHPSLPEGRQMDTEEVYGERLVCQAL